MMMGQLLMCILGSTTDLKAELLTDIVNNLRDIADDPSELHQYEKATGIKYNPTGILFDREVSNLINFPLCVYLDLTLHYMVLVV